MTSTAIPRIQNLRTLQGLIGLTLAFFALLASSAAWADPPGRVGRLAETEGKVWLYDGEQAEWVQARRNRPITAGDRLSAEQGARAEVQIGGGTLRLDGGTDAEFTRLDDAQVHVQLHGGSVALRVRGSTSVREFAILTAEGRFEPLRAGHYRVDVEDRSSLGESLDGAMRFESRDSVLDIGAGQRAEFWQERGVTHYAWAGPGSDGFGDWVVRADREDSRERSRYVSDEMTGAGDLERHGQWDSHPEYGALWYPRTVVVGWAPYRYGQWTYIRPWGWTWVDDAPWGFAPFHYGRWVHWGGRWGWAPGQYVVRPVYAPALVAWFGGPNVSVGINIGGPAVGWVPLAPREIYYPGYHHTPRYVRIVNATHGRWHGPNPRYERPVPTGPIMYTNQGVAGGVTVVPQGVMHGRQPIGNRAVVPADGRIVSAWQAGQPRGLQAVPPAPPAARVVPTPGGAVPAPPNAARTTQWGRAPAAPALPQPRVVAPQLDAAVSPPQRNATVPAPQRDAMPQRQGRDGRDARDARNGREDRGERRVAMPAVVPPMPQQRAEPPQARVVQPTVVAPPMQQPQPVRPAPRADDADPQRGQGRTERDRAEQRNGGGRPDDRMERVRDPRDQRQVR
jgi:hypothetical protein